MAQSVAMPALGESVTEGTVTKWLKNVGDTVTLDEPLLEVSTDKVDTEIPSPVAGVLTKILVPEDETVDVGTILAEVGDASEVNAAPPAPAVPAVPELPNPEIPSTVTTGSDGGAQVEWSYPTVPPIPPKAEEIPSPPVPPAAPAAPAVSEVPAAPVAPEVPAVSGTGQPIKMPALGESVTEGTVTKWLKNVGDTVALDEPLLEVSTDKVDTEVPSPIAGTITQIVVTEDETVDIGTVLAYVGGEVSAPAAPVVPDAPAVPAAPAAPQAPTAPAAPAAPVAPATPAAPSAPATPAGNQAEYATPIVRKLAAEKGVDLSKVHGTGVGGRIRKQDVLDAAGSVPAQPQPPVPPAAPAIPPVLPTPPAPAAATPPVPPVPEVPAAPAVPTPPAPAAVTPNATATGGELDMARLAQLFAEVAEAFAYNQGSAPAPQAPVAPAAPAEPAAPPIPAPPAAPAAPAVPAASTIPAPPVPPVPPIPPKAEEIPSPPVPPVPPVPPAAPAAPAAPAVSEVPAAPVAPEVPAVSGTGQPIKMPALGESVTEGTVTKWLKNVGDTVALDEPLLEVSTDKVDTEVPSPIAGTITQIVVTEDETVDVGTILAYVG